MDTTELIIDVLINLFLTVMLYEIVPLILKYFMEKYYSKEEAKKIAIINTICVYALITLYHIFVTDEAKLANIGPAFLWGTVAFYILKNNKGLQPPNSEVHRKSIEVTGNDIPVRDMLVQERPTKEIRTMYCRNCGNKVLETDNYCSNCGHYIKNTV